MIQFYLSPSGNLFLRENREKETSAFDLSILNTYKNVGLGAALIEICRTKASLHNSAELIFFRRFTNVFINELCHTPKETPQLEPVAITEQAKQMKAQFPLMQGAEYLHSQSLPTIWDQLNQSVLTQNVTGVDLSKFLENLGTRHYQVGRVCFHLAENKSQHEEYPFAFLATYAAAISSQGKLKYLPLSEALKEYAGVNNKKALINLLSPINRASLKSEFVRELLESNEIYHPYPLLADEAYQFLKEIEIYEESGLLVKTPNWWKSRPRVKVILEGDIQEKKNSYLSVENLIDFDINISIDGKKLTKAELKELLVGERGLRFFKGQWIEVDTVRIKELLKQIENDEKLKGLKFFEAMRMASNFGSTKQTKDDLIDYEFKGKLKELLDKLLNPQESLSRTFTPPKNLKATLRPYQEAGVKWLSLISQIGLGACLADDMGLGKTLQIITYYLQQVRENKDSKHLLIVPASLLGNWQSELNKFAPSIRFFIYHSSFNDKNILKEFEKSAHKKMENYELLITTYQLSKSNLWLKEIAWQSQVVDEAQAIKNPSTAQTKAVKAITAQIRIALTGTPVENKVMDLWSIFDFVNPGLLGNQRQFVETCRGLLEGESQYAPLKRLISPYILRRLKTDKNIIKDLPDKSELKTYCYLTKKQGAAYQACVNRFQVDLMNAVGIQKRGIVLSYLTQLKQICNHPSQQKGDEIFHESASGKLLRLKELCEEIEAKQEKVLVFSQYKEILPYLHHYLAEIFHMDGYLLDGSTSPKRRKEMVDEFQKEEGRSFFLLSLKAGGTGLNLTAANHVIHFDRWWNPAVENQATDRAFRIGQKRNVLVHKFISKGTLEEKIDLMIEEKRNLSDSLLSDSAENKITEMDNAEIIKLVSLNLNDLAM